MINTVISGNSGIETIILVGYDGKVTAVGDGTVTLRFTSILLGETEAYLSGLLDLPQEAAD